MAVLPVKIKDGCAAPGDGTISQSNANGYDQVKFQCADNGTYTLGGLNTFLSGAPASVTITPGNAAGPYSPISGPANQGDHSYTVDPPCTAGDDPVITVDS